MGYVEVLGRETYSAMMEACDTPLSELEGVFLHQEGPAPKEVRRCYTSGAPCNVLRRVLGS